MEINQCLSYVKLLEISRPFEPYREIAQLLSIIDILRMEYMTHLSMQIKKLGEYGNKKF